MTILKLDITFIKRKLCSKFERKLCISNIFWQLVQKSGIHTKIDYTQT